ncbi:unnamed protein product [Peronospora belbahrii]|uniref:Uncharacterized protein n=1 Tax=Peronospora belbahrii TaxID=622444 RepID=A0AAU9KNS5_9STRA|nr:unnamed protein product [Peronospora belbahrii]CAH0516848.1 unnamed protein product [Peronospora belbahrii]
MYNDTRYIGSSSSTSSIDSTTISGPYRVGNSDGDTCSYRAPMPGESCRQPRTCYECLNLNVVGMSAGCLLAPSGFCEDMSSYETTLDFRRNTTGEDMSLTGWYNYFPSINTTYCESSDKACMLCDELVNNGSLSQTSHWNLRTKNVSTVIERQFCRGDSGCVCIMACEAIHWKANMPAECDTSRSASDDNNASSADAISYSSMLIFYLVLQVVLLAVSMYKRGLCRRTASPPRPRPEGPYNNVNAISSPSNRLRLSGWRKMQNSLIEREKMQVANQEPQYMSSPRVEAANILNEADTLAQPLSSPISARNSETVEAAYMQVKDDSRRQRNNSVSGTHQAASVDSDVVVVDGPCDETMSGTGISRSERTLSFVAMLESRRHAA